MKRIVSIGFLGVALLFAAEVALAEKPQTSLVPVLHAHAGVPSVVPRGAIEVAPNVFNIGTARDVDGRLVEGFLIVDQKKGTQGRPPHAVKPPWAGGNNQDAQCFALLAKGARWKTTEQYVLNTGNDDGLNASFVEGRVETALAAWDDEVDFNVFGTQNAGIQVDGPDSVNPDDKNEIQFQNLGDSGTVAYTIVWGIFSGPPSQRALVEWDAVFNDFYPWGDAGSTDEVNAGNTDVMDFENVAVHEFGHAAGEGHPSDSCTEESMYRFVSFGETKKRTLGPGDVGGMLSLY